jgi:hypothetical protein
MTEVVETHDLTTPSQDGWAVDYRIRREDGETLTPRFAVGRERTPLPNERRHRDRVAFALANLIAWGIARISRERPG